VKINKLSLKLLEVCSLEELQTVMECTPLKKGYIRLRSIYEIMLGMPKPLVAKASFKSKKTFNKWIRIFLSKGPDGLINKPRLGRPRLVEGKVKERFIELLNESEGNYTAVKLYGILKEELQIEFSYDTIVRELHKENYNLRIPRRMPSGVNEEQRKAFKIKLETLLADKKNEIWFEDESGFEGDPRPRRKWTKRGTKSKLNYEGLHIRENVLGAVCPITGELVSLIFDYCDTNSFQALLDEIAIRTLKRSKKKKIILILDNVSWHKTKTLNWHHITPVYLSPYSPDFNPIERLWLRIKADFFSNFISKTPEDLINRIIEAINSYLNNPDRIISLCKIG
jgi:transposase